MLKKVIESPNKELINFVKVLIKKFTSENKEQVNEDSEAQESESNLLTDLEDRQQEIGTPDEQNDEK